MATIDTEPGTAAHASGARVLDGRRVAEAIRRQVVADLEVARNRLGWIPGIAVVQVGDDPASHVYARRIMHSTEIVGAHGRIVELPADTTAPALRARLTALSDDPEVGGIILQLPLPGRLSRYDVAESIDPDKDLDGIHPRNAGLVAQGCDAFAPSCPEAALEILRASGISLAGRHATVVGRSNVVGKPAALLLLREHATVTVCHRRTRDLAAEVRRAEVLIVAAGSPSLVTGDMVRPGAVVVDCGINVVDGRIVGDVDPVTVAPVAAALSPVPGGVGPVTNAVLLRHLARAVTNEMLRSGQPTPTSAA
jgi:methylenetetrahydrofolate dehydrogenase (NADP+) / methenyltetrahydrofolate cyclohydrolase